jgi:hypothetical protein
VSQPLAEIARVLAPAGHLLCDPCRRILQDDFLDDQLAHQVLERDAILLDLACELR